MAIGFSPKPRGGWTRITTLPACRVAATISPSAFRVRSTNSSPGAGPQASVTAATRSSGSSVSQRR